MSKSEMMAREILAKAQEKARNSDVDNQVVVNLHDNPDVHYLNLLHHIEVLASEYGLKLTDNFAGEYIFKKLQS